MKTILATFLIVFVIFPVSAFGEIQTITHSVKQPFGGSQSPDDARIAAMSKAKREALEIAGTYIESLTVMKNSQIDKDEILALAAGILKTEVVSQKNYISGDAFGIEVVVKVVVDTSLLEERVKKLLQDRTHLEQLNQARKKEKELLDKVAKLEEENQHLSAQNKSSKDLKKKFEKASRGLTAVEWVDKALSLWTDEYVSKKTSSKAIEYLNEAVRLNPDYWDAYSIRGIAHYALGKYDQAIQDFSEAIRLKPDDTGDFVNRGTVYSKLEQYSQAIKDYDQAIHLKSDNATAYCKRGDAYSDIGQYNRAIQDFDRAIHLKPDYIYAYRGRGFANFALGQFDQSIRDCSEVIRLNPNDEKRKQKVMADDFVVRGIVYSKLGQHNRAIQDFDEAIRLKPDYAGAYNNRGIDLMESNKTEEGCRSLKKACELGSCEGLKVWREKGKCR